MNWPATYGAFRHGHASRENGWSPTYYSYTAMLSRCRNPNRNRAYRYNKRGIKVCERWLKFENFLADMGERPEGTSLDRIDGNGNYTPENCRWATPAEQARNHPSAKLITFNGHTMLTKEWVAHLGISRSQFARRVKKFGLEATLAGQK